MVYLLSKSLLLIVSFSWVSKTHLIFSTAWLFTIISDPTASVTTLDRTLSIVSLIITAATYWIGAFRRISFQFFPLFYFISEVKFLTYHVSKQTWDPSQFTILGPPPPKIVLYEITKLFLNSILSNLQVQKKMNRFLFVKSCHNNTQILSAVDVLLNRL